MKTFQDLLDAGPDERARMEFARGAVAAHRQSPEYRAARDAGAYYARQNVTMSRYRKLVRDVSGRAVPDLLSPDYKLTHGFFRRFVTQQVQYVLSNGVTFRDQSSKARLGPCFDNRLAALCKKAMVDGVAFGFWNLDHLEVFGFADTARDPGFVPLYDEDSGALRAGIRYWEPAGKSFRMTLYEEDGYSEYIRRRGEDLQVLTEKRPYICISYSDGTSEGRNYGAFPIVPMFANDLRQSELTGIRAAIDCYDFIKSGMANNVDETSAFYWTLKGSGGMTDMDLQRFLERMRVVRATVLDDGMDAQAHTLDVPVEANERLLDRLRADLYEDFMLLDVEKALSGSLTATAIRLAYQQQDDKCGDFEYCIRDFLAALLPLAGVDDEPSFQWNRVANQLEETQMILSAAQFLDAEAVLKKLPWLTPEEAGDILARRAQS